MIDRVAWFQLAAAALLFRSTWIHPRGPHSQRGGYSVAASLALLGAIRLAELSGLLEIAALVVVAGLSAVGVVSFVLAFRSGELKLRRGNP